MPSFTRSTSTAFRLPDLMSNLPFTAAYHRSGDAIATASEKWVEQGCRIFTADMRRHLNGLMAGQLAAYCYNECSDERFRVVCDFMHVLFLLDDFSDELMTKDTEILADVVMNAIAFPESYRPTNTKGKEQPEIESDASSLTRDYWTRLVLGAGPQVQARCAENVELYLIAVHQQANHRDTGDIPALEDYIQLRRLSSGCKPLFDLLEYSLDMQLPDYIIENPLLITLKDCVNDFVAFSNDIFSYNVEQSRGDKHNLVTVIMKNYDLDLQSAVDCAGDMCREALEKYCETKACFPSYGTAIDKHLASFFRGLESWLSGSLEWSFVTPRYFGSRRSEIKKHRWVRLLSHSRIPVNGI
ncbi:terpenoid synthase [Ramaria rubella]|nr:terpenoid synthase [Ramaria rubella]